MSQPAEHHPLEAAFAALPARGLGGAGEALRILINEESNIERAHFLNSQPHKRMAERTDYANGFNPKTVITRVVGQLESWQADAPKTAPNTAPCLRLASGLLANCDHDWMTGKKLSHFARLNTPTR